MVGYPLTRVPISSRASEENRADSVGSYRGRGRCIALLLTSVRYAGADRVVDSLIGLSKDTTSSNTITLRGLADERGDGQ